MKTKLLLVLLLIGLHYTAFAQVAHDYKPNCCRLAGATFTTEKSCYCSGCAAVDKKNAEATAAEDKRVKEVAAKKEEEKKQKAIAEAQKKKEEQAKKGNDSKANQVHLGFGDAKNSNNQKEVRSINSKLKETHPSKNITKGECVLNQFPNNLPTRLMYSELYEFRVDLAKPYKFWGINLVDIGKGWYFSINKALDAYHESPSIYKIYNYNLLFFDVFYENDTDEVFQRKVVSTEKSKWLEIIGVNSTSELIMPNDKNYFLKKTPISIEIEKAIKIKSLQGANILMITSIDGGALNLIRADKSEFTSKYFLQENFRNYYYFDLKDYKWKELLEFKTQSDYENLVKN